MLRELENQSYMNKDDTTAYLMAFKMNDIFYSFDNLGLVNSLKYHVTRQDFEINKSGKTPPVSNLSNLINFFNRLLVPITDGDGKIKLDHKFTGVKNPVDNTEFKEITKDFWSYLVKFFDDLKMHTYNGQIIFGNIIDSVNKKFNFSVNFKEGLKHNNKLIIFL